MFAVRSKAASDAEVNLDLEYGASWRNPSPASWGSKIYTERANAKRRIARS